MAVLDLGINYGASYSINFATDVIANCQGQEQRRSLFSQPLIKVAIGNRRLTKTELDYLRDFFYSVQGRLGEFEIRDWSDYQVVGGTLGPEIEGRQSVIKTYTIGGESVSRLLTAVVEETIVVDEGSVTCEFNVPVRFDQDSIPVIFEAYSANQDNLFTLQDLTCTEVRKPWPDMAIAAPPASVAASLNLGKDYGTLGSDNYSTNIVSLPSGWDNRQANYSGAIGTWNIGDRVLNKAELAQFIAMFRVCRGRLSQFSFYDWQTESTKSVRFDSDSMGFQFEAHGRNYYGTSDESFFTINGVPIRVVIVLTEHIESFSFATANTAESLNIWHSFTFTTTNPNVPNNAQIYLVSAGFDSWGSIGTFNTGSVPIEDNFIYNGPEVFIGVGKSVSGQVIEESQSGVNNSAGVYATLRFVW